MNAVKPSNPMTLAVILRIKHILFCTHAHAHILISILFTAEIISHSISISSKVILKLVPSFCVQQRVHARERERERAQCLSLFYCVLFSVNAILSLSLASCASRHCHCHWNVSQSTKDIHDSHANSANIMLNHSVHGDIIFSLVTQQRVEI